MDDSLRRMFQAWDSHIHAQIIGTLKCTDSISRESVDRVYTVRFSCAKEVQPLCSHLWPSGNTLSHSLHSSVALGMACSGSVKPDEGRLEHEWFWCSSSSEPDGKSCSQSSQRNWRSSAHGTWHTGCVCVCVWRVSALYEEQTSLWLWTCTGLHKKPPGSWEISIYLKYKIRETKDFLLRI